MNRFNEAPLYSYSWHQSHDQATVLILVPYGAQEEDVEVVIERNYLVAGVRGQPAIVKGRLYGTVDTTNSVWQLEPRPSHSRVRTISTASSASSYALVSDPEISSSFAASLESGQVSDAEDLVAASPALSSPSSTPTDERMGFAAYRPRQASRTSSRAVSPGHAVRSAGSSFSSLESLHSHHSARLLTLHLEKEHPAIWPSLIVGSVSEAISPYPPTTLLQEPDVGEIYNMDPTSLVLIALELYDIRKDKEAAFEYFVRAWLQARTRVATVRLVSHYVPARVSIEPLPAGLGPVPGTNAYYVHCLGGPRGLAQLYLDAGLLHLEGAANALLSSSASTLSSIRMPARSSSDISTEAWRRDRDAAGRYFERARALDPDLKVPVLPPEADPSAVPQSRVELEMPSLDIHREPSAPGSMHSGQSNAENSTPAVRRRRRKAESTMVDDTKGNEVDNTWYLYLPGLVGAGTAIVVFGVVGALSFSNWRRGQST